jgi:hypothetical protein
LRLLTEQSATTHADPDLTAFARNCPGLAALGDLRVHYGFATADLARMCQRRTRTAAQASRRAADSAAAPLVPVLLVRPDAHAVATLVTAHGILPTPHGPATIEWRLVHTQQTSNGRPTSAERRAFTASLLLPSGVQTYVAFTPAMLRSMLAPIAASSQGSLLADRVTLAVALPSDGGAAAVTDAVDICLSPAAAETPSDHGCLFLFEGPTRAPVHLDFGSFAVARVMASRVPGLRSVPVWHNEAHDMEVLLLLKPTALNVSIRLEQTSSTQ